MILHVHLDIFHTRSTNGLIIIRAYINALIALGALIIRILVIQNHSFAHVLDMLSMQHVALVVFLYRQLALCRH